MARLTTTAMRAAANPCSECDSPNSTPSATRAGHDRAMTMDMARGKVSASGWPSHCITTVVPGAAARATTSVLALR